MNFFEKSTFHNGRYIPNPDGGNKTLLDVLKWKWTSRAKPWPRWRGFPDLPLQNSVTLNQTSATWINHSTVLIKVDGMTLLTDPIFSDYAGPFRGLGPKRKTADKLENFTSGIESHGNARQPLAIKYFLVAILFVLFDVEVIFMYPWAVNFEALGRIGFWEMLIFIGTLLLGFVYIIKKGALTWD